MLFNKKDEYKLIKNYNKSFEDDSPYFLSFFYEKLNKFIKYLIPNCLDNKNSKHTLLLEEFLKTLIKYENLCSEREKLLKEFILHPLIKEGIHYKNPNLMTTSHYKIWHEKASRWMQLLKENNKDDINKNVHFHYIQSIHKTIMKDIMLLMEYRDFQLEKLQLTEDEKDLLISKIGKETHSQLKALNELYLSLRMNHSENILIKIKEKIDEERGKVFETCLSIIDKYIEQEFPFHKIKKVNEDVANIIDEIIKLENKIALLENMLLNKKELKRAEKKKINDLYQEAYKLSLDIRLSEELFLRLKESMKKMEDSLNPFYHKL